MNLSLFQQAQSAYASRDFQSALSAFTSCLQDEQYPLGAGEAGRLYHQIGNCLVKLGNPNEAIQAYTLATADPAYDAVGAVNYNLGMAYAGLNDFENAVSCFNVSVSDPRYGAAYKAYSGMGSALMKMGMTAEAGVAFRNAALSEANPDPTKALLNLGVCFMALGRPADAIISYENALQFDAQGNTRNRLYANLGQAYVACGYMQKAVAAFEEALHDQNYLLSDSASVDYQRAVASVAQGTASIPLQGDADLHQNDMSGFDVIADDSSNYQGDPSTTAEQDAYLYYSSQNADTNDPEAQNYGAAAYDDRFFNATDEELEQWSKGIAKKERKRRNTVLKLVLVVVVILLLIAGAGLFLFSQGYGYPSQESVVQELFADPEGSAELFSGALSEESVDSFLDLMVADENITIDGYTQGMTSSQVYVTATTQEGGSVRYQVSLVRDMLGWKVSKVSLYFLSEQ